MQEARKKDMVYNETSFTTAIPTQCLFQKLLCLCTAEAEQVVTKDGSKNRSSAFLRPRVAGLFSLLSHFSAGLTAQHLELWSFQPLPRHPFLLQHCRTPWWCGEIWHILVPDLSGNSDAVFICIITKLCAEHMADWFLNSCVMLAYMSFTTIIIKHLAH